MYLDQLFLSPARSAIQLFLNLENFNEQIESTSYQSSRFASAFKVIPIQKNLKSFTLEDFSDLINILPSYLQSPQSKPIEVIKFIIQEFKDSSKIFSDVSQSKNFIKVRASSISRTPISDFFQINSKSCSFVEIVWDVNPTALLVVDIFEKLEKSAPLELLGLVSARGFYYNSYVKSKANWKSFEDGRILSATGLLSYLVSSFAHPVLLFVKQTTGFVHKIQEINRIREFAKLQDARLGNNLKEIWADKEVKNEDLPERQEFNDDGRRGTCRDFYSKGGGNEMIKQDENRPDRATSDNLRYRNRSSQPVATAKDKVKEFNKDVGYFDKFLKSNDTTATNGKNSEVDGRMYRTNYTFTTKNENLESSKGSYSSFNPNFTEKIDKGEESRSYCHSRSMPLGFKVIDSNVGQMPEIKMVGLQGPCKVLHSSQSLTKESLSSIPEPKAQDKSYFEKFQPESSPLSKYRNISHESKHKDSKHTDRRNLDYVPEGNYSEPPIESKYSEKRFTETYTPQSRTYQDFNFNESQYKDSFLLNSYSGESLKAEFSSWKCPKCTVGNTESVYECSSCRFINWDRFYSIKAKSIPIRSGSIPAKTDDRYSFLYKTPNEDDKKNYLDYSNRYTHDIDFGKNRVYWDEDRKRNTSGLYFKQHN